ncbi:unnamed protein product [Camellia sinensis]
METETMQSCARKILERELRDINENPSTHISFGPLSDDNMFQWQGIIIGPVDTPLEGVLFHLSIYFPIDYPFKPPTVKFLTKVYHPNVDEDGTIDINILGEEWSPALTTEKLLLSIISILMNPILEEGNQNQVSNL